MNEDTMKGKWKEMTGKLKKKWGKLTDDDLTFVNGSKEELSGKIQKHYGYAKEQADKEVHDFMNHDDDDATS
jgi:uncharacterized protein YjbJ (UPF0337 family)